MAKAALRPGLALLAVGLVLSLGKLPEFQGPNTGGLLALLAILVAAAIGGRGPALATTALLALVTAPPAWTTWRVVRHLVFVASGSAIALTAGQLRQARRRAEGLVREVERERDALRRSEGRYRAFVAQSTEGIWCFEATPPIATDLPEDEQVERMFASSTLAECNDAVARMYGFERAEEIRGGRLAQFLDPADPENRDYLRAFVRSGYRLADAESHEFDRAGQPRVMLNNLVGIVEEGRLVRAWGTQRDVTEARRFAQEREGLLGREQAARREAEAAKQAADGFLALISHELRTPLAPILATASALREAPELPDALRPDIDLICRNVEVEAHLIDDLLDATRIRTGKLRLDRRPVDAHEVIARAVEVCRAEVEAAGLDLVLELDAGAHHVLGDPVRLQQVAWNLLKNALKFTPAGGTVAVRTRDEAGGLAIEVADDGIGIAPEFLPKLFDIGEQEAEAVRLGGRGLGLGLAICRAVVEGHAGRLSAASPGRGSGATFTVRLPVAEAAGPAVAPAEPEPDERTVGLKVLVVEDDPDSLRALGRALRRIGYVVEEAPDVGDAVAIAEGFDFDVLVSDLQLPDGSGLELLGRLSADRPVRAIALSGRGRDVDLRRSDEAGFLAHLTKPVDLATLDETIQRVAAGFAPTPGT